MEDESVPFDELAAEGPDETPEQDLSNADAGTDESPKRRQQNATAPQKLKLVEREAKATKMRTMGATYDRIGKELDCTRQAAFQMVRRVLDRELAETKQSGRALIARELRILDELQLGIYQAGVRGGVYEIDRILKISESRRKLLGLDAPEAIKIGGMDEGVLNDILADIGGQSAASRVAAQAGLLGS